MVCHTPKKCIIKIKVLVSLNYWGSRKEENIKKTTCPVECSEKGVEPSDHSPQAENNVKKSYELNSKRINHCYICKPIVECTYVSCYERHL